MKKSKDKKKTYIKTTYRCPKCKNINEITASGYGKHHRVCPHCNEDFMFEYDPPAKTYRDLSKEKIDKLPPEYRDKIYEEIEKMKEEEKRIKEFKDTHLRDENGRIIKEKKLDGVSATAKLIIDKMIKEGLNIETKDPKEDARNKKRFEELFNEIANAGSAVRLKRKAK